MRGAILTAICLAALGAGQSRADGLNLLIWESYIDEGILADFTAKTGIPVRQTIYDSGDARDEILSDPASNVDLVITNENGARLFGKRGVLAAIGPDTVASVADYPESWMNRCAGYGLPYLWGTMGILYRSDKVTTVPSSWSDLMRPAEYLRGHIAMFDDHAEAFVAPLAMLGKSVSANDDETLKQAYAALKAQSPFVLTYTYVITSIQNPEHGRDIYMALGYSGDQHVLNEKGSTPGLWRYAVPKEGTLSWLDCLAVTTRASDREAALKLLDFITNAQNAARNAESLNMPTASVAALKRLPREMRENPEIYTAPEILAVSQVQEELTVESVRARRRILSSLVQFSDAR